MLDAKLLKVLGLQTSDFSAYYDLVEALKTRRIPFVTLAPGEPVPSHVGALITTPAEAARLSTEEVHAAVVAYSDPDRTIADAMRALQGPGPFRRCVVGVDPGERPGVAVLVDGRVVRLVHAPSPEAVRRIVDEVLASVPAERFVLRVGNGAPTSRDRILHTLAGLMTPSYDDEGVTGAREHHVAVELELVDETRSTPHHARGSAERDTAAATSIALTPGAPLAASDVRPVRPTEGELRDIQRKSRLQSQGSVTISRALARYVALGRITLDEAVQRQMTKA